jgi:hypothetical protein
MNREERERRNYDFFSTLPPQLQNRLAEQKSQSDKNRAAENQPVIDKFYFSKWFY